jgi:hypothetical protein
MREKIPIDTQTWIYIMGFHIMSYDIIAFASFPIVDGLFLLHINKDIKWKTLYFVYPLKIAHNLGMLLPHKVNYMCKTNGQYLFYMKHSMSWNY